MNQHQVLTGAVNAGDNCYSVGSVEGVHFIAYSAGCNIVILSNDFERVQIIPGILHDNVQVTCIDCSNDVGKIAAAYGSKVLIFEPTPLLQQTSSHKLDYKWIQTTSLETTCLISVISWNIEGNKLLTGGTSIQLWHLLSLEEANELKIRIDGLSVKPDNDLSEMTQLKWECLWQCQTSSPVCHLCFSPDGTLFYSAGRTDRLVKIWYESAAKTNPINHYCLSRPNIQFHRSSASRITNEINYTFIYIAHPRAVTGISWRKTSKYIPSGSIANMLVTSCRDNICRLWVQTLLPDDGLVNFSQIENLSNHTLSRNSTQRHSQKLLQRLKHMKSFNQFKKRQAVKIEEEALNSKPISTLPSTFSVHDFHSFGICGTAITPGFHFHLSAAINAETDIPLVPSLSVNNPNEIDSKSYPNFVIHWLNNKEMVFTQSAERILQEISSKVFQQQATTSDSVNSENSDLESESGCEIEVDANYENDDLDSTITPETGKKIRHKLCHKPKTKKHSIQEQSSNSADSKPFSSSASTVIDFGNLINSSSSAFNNILDRKFEALLKDWHCMIDALFSIHPVDGSLLVWLVEWLDEASPGFFRQAQVSFSSRIPNAIPLGDAATMSYNVALYSPHIYLDLKSSMHLSYLTPKVNLDSIKQITIDPINHSSNVCMVTKHNNGSLYLWHITFADPNQFTQVVSISHKKRICGHRFRVNDISCHPVLPLLLTTSHHNIPKPNLFKSPSSSPVSSISTSSSSSNDNRLPQLQSVPNFGFCSELILWKVDPVGPLSKSGGVTELARINCLETSAFANVAWIPTLLPSTTSGSISNSPSACFIASDGHQLRVYQAVIDARTLLSEISAAQRRNHFEHTQSEDTTSSELNGFKTNLHNAFKIVSLQSTSRPGCILELDAISDAIHDWKDTQLLHVFQDQLIRGDKVALKNWKAKHDQDNLGLVELNLEAVVDLRNISVFEEPFFLVVLEKDNKSQSVLHMWKLIISSQTTTDLSTSGPYSYAPDNDSDDEFSSASLSPDGGEKGGGKVFKDPLLNLTGPLQILTNKVCKQPLPIAPEIEVIHASPAAGHLSSSSIYPACFAPYLICTTCSDGFIRFWRCQIENTIDIETGLEVDLNFNWVEWEMLLNQTKSSAIEIPGLPLYVSCAYSGRIACAYKLGHSFSRPTSKDPSTRFININLAIYECESTGGSEWILEDTIYLKNIIIPSSELRIDIMPLISTNIRNKKASQRLSNKISCTDEHTRRQSANNIQRLLSVPSYTTIQSLKKMIEEQGNQYTLTQKSIVQLDWVSTEDGSHILTVSVGDEISVFTPVSTDIAQSNLQAMNTTKAGPTSSRILLKQVSSIGNPFNKINNMCWMKMRTTKLQTADDLPPLPVQMSWVRDGILVVGMDNEMHIYTQWKDEASNLNLDLTDSRVLTEEGLLMQAQESSYLRLPTHPLPLSPSLALLNKPTRSPSIADFKKIQQSQQGSNNDQKINSSCQNGSILQVSQFPDFGVFEAHRLACSVLPQYHPKQLMELLAFGKIHRVRAILSHLVKSLCSMDSLKSYLAHQQFDFNDSEKNSRSWVRTRTLSVAAAPGSPNLPDIENFSNIIPEELQLDYTEITSIRPLPLFALIEAEFERPKRVTEKSTNLSSKENSDYDALFNLQNKTSVDTLDEIFEKNFNYSIKTAKTEEQSLSTFNSYQARLLTKVLTHSHLPGLSSLDQMHLLALADAVASFDPSKSSSGLDFDSKNASDLGEQPSISADSLDDCGLRYLLTMRQYMYLLRCLPLIYRKMLQKDGLASSNLVWAFHSETQDELIQLIPSVAKCSPKWIELKELGVGWWLRNNYALKRLIEQVAKTAFQTNQDPLDAALFYIAMKKKSLVWGLYRSINDRRMTEFFQNNFTEDKWRKAALKNAYALLGKQRFKHAAAFFLLAGSLWDAVEVCLNKLEDIQLAMVITRLYEGDIEAVCPTLKKILYQEILGCDSNGSNHCHDKAHPDPFLRSISYWMLQDYNSALTTLLEPDVGSAHPKFANTEDDNKDASTSPSVFNFYLYLRNQPLIVRRHLAKCIQEHKDINREASNDIIHETSSGMEAITPFERRLYFITAHQHFKSGCPSLALEVLSRLPHKIASDEHSESKKQPTLEKLVTQRSISTGVLPDESDKYLGLFDSSSVSKVNQDNLDIDWGLPVSNLGMVNTSDLNLDFDHESSSDESEDGGLEMKISEEKTASENHENDDVKLDIMAQQLKFIACLKILMEELSTLATGFEVDGGRLRYHLYVWLEKSVRALKLICNYRTFSMRGQSTVFEGQNDHLEQRPGSSMIVDDLTSSHLLMKPKDQNDSNDLKPTLHDVLMAENLDFEAKLQRASRRKEWLQGNEALLRTLLSYCSLHGSHGGGLSSVRMELILLLQELQQERSQHQLLSPLPFPTTLPLLAASVACQKTVIADPIRHLNSITTDILEEILSLKSPPLSLPLNYCEVFVLRDLGLSLSACVYQSLCNSDNLNLNVKDDLHSSSAVCINSHLLSGNQFSKRFCKPLGESDEPLKITTPPNKWPGVQSLRALLAREKDDDSPKLHTLLCEAYVAVYMSQLLFALAACDSHLLYRLIGQSFTEQNWSHIFGGGAKKKIYITSSPKTSLSSASSARPNLAEDQSSSIDFINALSKHRVKLHLKILQQLNQEKPQSLTSSKEERMTYKEQFVPPQMSIISYLMDKPKLIDEWMILDYDSSESVESEDDDRQNLDDLDEKTTDKSTAKFGQTLSLDDNSSSKPIDAHQYAWLIMRYAIIKLAQDHFTQFLSVSGVEFQDLPTVSFQIHAAYKVLETWSEYMKQYLNNLNGPPPQFLPNDYIEQNRLTSGPSIWKYKVLLEMNNTPFRAHNSVTKPMKRLWNYLIRQEKVQDIFIRYIFGKPKSKASQMRERSLNDKDKDGNDENADLVSTELVRIVHKEQDNISAFCLNSAQNGLISIATPKEIQELDIKLLLEPTSWLEEETEFDILNMSK